ncbi:uncharacterized protein LOC116215477 [Punica granatum]|uniref:Uncharacterized protein n=2 Tax=Punica granatum TaxID=22663 RepID=A0A218WQS6_PUNGR|nr:uncharacterized protein LOC116215477 [Punica granatum]OWM74986.1 hypothetical protein CDL15_Pgr021337 [Punica granatum]PKI77431.1 hypothetical protein CRG98_002204 [Punica granatum]
MQNPPHQRSESFVIQVITREGDRQEPPPQRAAGHPRSPPSSNFSSMKIFNRFRKIIMRLVFSLPSSRGPSSGTSRGGGSSDYKPEPPKTSCSSYYSSHSHYNEAIADCIEFFNKSSQEGWLSEGRKSDVNIV